MPYAAKRPCAHAGCKSLVGAGQRMCAEHRKQSQREQDQQRGSASERGYNVRWQKARATYLRSHPLCVMCKAEGRLMAARVVDHITPHRGDQELFWDTKNNWQALCTTCHSKHKQRIEKAYGKEGEKRKM
ncbi:HNH endonuclease [Iodobacter sp. CM08]|uniref:HNH endonuclease n=1 Tax=Iodobacter sp. CM08 TaxID=3085902 RepID=UPI002980D478|nr:HNH endonuclease [Iodobacter sp. CM08]MDW5417733.1 HNH endonuclease [Iodobacter sp. CM08]